VLEVSTSARPAEADRTIETVTPRDITSCEKKSAKPRSDARGFRTLFHEGASAADPFLYSKRC
jgi:hypothetical protein